MDAKDWDPCVMDYDSYESWRDDTVNNGYLRRVGSSFDYPDDLIDLENGEYVSHMAEPVNAAISYDDLNVEEDVVKEVLDFLGSKGYDTSNREVRNYADAVAEYIDMSRQAYQSMGEESPYTVEQWYDDTLMNYPYELEDLPTV
jgi:hypothetical protein